MADADYVLGAQKLFTLLFVTLGPIKLLGPFARSTAPLADAELRALAVRAGALAALIALAGGFLGVALLESWQIPVFALRLTTGLILFVVAFRLVLEPYGSPTPTPAPDAADGGPNIMKVVFPMVLTPYGLAAVIVLLVMSQGAGRTSLIVGMLLAVMLLNLLAMVFIRQVLPVIGPLLQAVGAVLGVLQLTLAVQVILTALRGLGVLQAPT
jgi:multiple antibiotic resistance protein